MASPVDHGDRVTAHGPARDDALLPATRWLAAFIIPFLVVAFVVVYPVPTATGRWFAWEMKPTMSAMVLGSAYLGGAYFFARVLRARAWHTVQAGFIPVTLFASSLGIATVIHWDKFNHDHLAFWLWAGLYFTTPFLVFGVWWRNRARDPGSEADARRLSKTAASLVGLSGLAALLLGLFLFVVPGRAVDVWPWTLSPLTARVLGAVLMLGVVGIGIALDRRLDTARLMLNVAQVMIALMLLAALRATHEFFPERALTWMLGAGLVVVLVASIAVEFRLRRLPR